MSNNDSNLRAEDKEQPEIHFRDLAPAIEFVCWTVVALAPILRLVNGAAVTSDQFVVQVLLFSMALSGALGLRVYNWRIARRGS